MSTGNSNGLAVDSIDPNAGNPNTAEQRRITDSNLASSLSESLPQSEEGDSVISIKSLWKIFGKNTSRVLAENPEELDKTEVLNRLGCVVALQGVGFDVGKGETFVVMGLSGSGKSTLVRCLIRLIEPTSGEILIDNQDILRYSESELMELRRTKVAMVFQHYGLLPHRSVLENAAYGLEVRGVDLKERQERASAMLEKVGLSGWENSSTNELSGGMQQRVGLARALTVDPEILLMDEPFSGLDPLIRRQMREELAILQEELKKTIVFITHDLDEAITVGDRIAIMQDGKIIQLGTPSDIVTSPANQFVQDFTRGISKTRVLAISHIMQPPEAVVSENDSAHSALEKMTASGQNIAFVVGEDRAYVGAVSKEKVAPAAASNQVSIREIGIDTPRSVLHTTPIEDALPLVLGHGMPIPITDDKGRLTGVATQNDLLEIVARCSQEQKDLSSAPSIVT